MLKISEFSKLSHLTIKALRFYEKEGLLKPAAVDEWTGYRFYETSQLEIAAKIKSFRQPDLSIEEIKAAFSGADLKEILQEKFSCPSNDSLHLSGEDLFFCRFFFMNRVGNDIMTKAPNLQKRRPARQAMERLL